MGKKKKLGIVTGIAYGGGNLAANLLVTTVSAFISYFYTDVAGISIGIAGIILLVCRLTDGISDLCMGAIVDKTNTKYGKARPWLLWLSGPYLLTSILLWYAPDFGKTGQIIYAVITYLLSIAIVYTAISVPYNTLCSLITKDGTQRTALSAFRTAFGFGGAMLVNMATLPIVNMFGGGKKGWLCLGICYGIAGSLLYLFTFLKCKEEDAEEIKNESMTKPMKKTPVVENIRALFKNKYWIMVIIMVIISFTISGFSGVNVYYAQYIFGNENLVGMMSIAQYLPICAGIIVVTPLVKKYGKRNVSFAGSIISLAGCLVMALFSENWPVFFAGLLIKGCGSAPLAVASFAMLADTVEYGEWKFGVRSDGLAYSAEGFGEKVGSAVGGILVTSLMSIGGYVANQAVQTSGTIIAMKSVMSYIPIGTTIITLIILWNYDLDKKYPQIITELEARKKGN